MNILNGLTNTGGNPKNRAFDFKQLRRIILVPKYNSSEVLNTLANVAGVTKAALQAKFDAANINNRYFPLPPMKNVEFVRGESTKYAWADDSVTYIKQGIKTFKAMFDVSDVGPALLKRLQSWRACDFGMFIGDTEGNFGYILDSAGVIVKPLEIEGQSFDVRMIGATDKEPAMMEVTFNLAPEINDGDFRYIPKADLDFDIRSDSDVYALWSVVLAEVSNTLTHILFTAKTDYGVPISGLVKTEIYLYDNTGSAAITLTSLTETGTTGAYDALIPAQTENDSYTMNILKSKYAPEDTLSGTLTA